MRKKHFVQSERDTKSPFCAGRVDMVHNGFDTTEDKDQVTCRLCMMRLGIIEDTRGNWDNRTR